jgi:aspartate carbamoyltransferase regulatory subunit
VPVEHTQIILSPPLPKMPRSSQRAECIKNLTTILRLEIKQSAFEAMLNINDEETSEDNSDMEELLLTLVSIKKKIYMSERIRLERPPDITNYLFCLDSSCFKQEF